MRYVLLDEETYAVLTAHAPGVVGFPLAVGVVQYRDGVYVLDPDETHSKNCLHRTPDGHPCGKELPCALHPVLCLDEHPDFGCCTHKQGHDGPHVAYEYGTDVGGPGVGYKRIGEWDVAPPKLCGHMRYAGFRQACLLPHGHEGHHDYKIGYRACGAKLGFEDYCVLPVRHHGLHEA